MQTAYYRPCKTTNVHHRVCGASEWHYFNKDVSGGRLPANDCLDLSCGLNLFISLTEDTALLSVS